MFGSVGLMLICYFFAGYRCGVCFAGDRGRVLWVVFGGRWVVGRG